MLFRTYIQFPILLTGLIAGGGILPAQTLTNFEAWKDPQNVDHIPDWTRIMLNREFRNLTGTNREERLAQVLSALKDIAGNTLLAPSTRYNAVLAAGQLDLIAGNPPTAYPPALDYLAAVYRDAEMPHYLKYAALLGIVRHTHCGIESDRQDAVIGLLLETATSTSTFHDADTIDPEIWHWFRMTALDGLTGLKTAGLDGNIAAELLAMIEHQVGEIDMLSKHYDLFIPVQAERLRRAVESASKAAKTLGDLDFRPATEIDTEKIADVLLRLTKSVYGVGYRLLTVYMDEDAEQIETRPDALKEQIAVLLKTCMQSVVWGIRGGFLVPNRAAEHSFYATLSPDDPALAELDALLADIWEVSLFLDEGEQSQRSAMPAGTAKAFRFELHELREVLEKRAFEWVHN